MKNKKVKNFTVRAPQVAMMVGILGVMVFGFLIVLSPFMWPNESAKNRIVFYVIFGLAVALSAYLIVKTLRFRVVVKNEKITVTPLLSKTYTFTFSDIETVQRQVKNRYKGKAERIIIRTKQGKRIVVDSSYVSYGKLVERVIDSVETSRLPGAWREKIED